MSKRRLTATATVLGAFTGAWTIASMGATPAYAWTDDNPAGVSGCTDPSVNDAGTVIGNCLVGNAQKAFVRLSAASSSTFLAPLAATVGGVPCKATGINNATAGNEIIIGACADANAVLQGVVWKSATPGTAPILLQPLSLLGLLPHVQTTATAYNTPGVVVGVSTNNEGSDVPASWSSTGAPTQLVGPLLTSNLNCTPVDINDNARTPAIIGNCKASGPGGGTKAVLWQGTTAAYTVLPVPTGAKYCQASTVNLTGQILGQCFYTTDTHRVVLWGAGGTGPAVLQTVGGGTALRTFDAGLNDNGLVACNYLAGGASAGFKQPCRWDPTGGNTDAVAIAAPGGATGPAIVTAIGNNGKMVGIYEVAAGVIHSFHVAPGGTVGIDEGTPAGGPNTIVTSMSKSGTFEAAVSEDPSEHNHVEAQAVP